MTNCPSARRTEARDQRLTRTGPHLRVAPFFLQSLIFRPDFSYFCRAFACSRLPPYSRAFCRAISPVYHSVFLSVAAFLCDRILSSHSVTAVCTVVCCPFVVLCAAVSACFYRVILACWLVVGCQAAGQGGRLPWGSVDARRARGA
jgi:hypothetical protein